MAQTAQKTCLAASWTQLDSLASHTLIEFQNRGTEPIGLTISFSDPTSGTAWNGMNQRLLAPGDTVMWRLGTGDHVWGRAQSVDQTAPDTTNVYEAV